MRGAMVTVVVFYTFATKPKICGQWHKTRQVPRGHKPGNCGHLHCPFGGSDTPRACMLRSVAAVLESTRQR